jgi:hypothetical protein
MLNKAGVLGRNALDRQHRNYWHSAIRPMYSL